MFTKTLLPLAALIAFPAFGQQAATPNPQQQAPSAALPSAPYPPAAPLPPRKQSQFEINLRQKLCKQNSNLVLFADLSGGSRP